MVAPLAWSADRATVTACGLPLERGRGVFTFSNTSVVLYTGVPVRARCHEESCRRYRLAWW